MKKIIIYIIFFYFPLSLLAQPSNFRDYKVRKWHTEFDWTAETNAVSYEIFKDDVLHGTSTGTTYTAVNLLTSTNHIFKIRSVFSNGAKSSFSYEINVRTGLYPIERTAFTTEVWAGDRPLPATLDSYTNEYGLFEKPIAFDRDFTYPKVASLTTDNEYVVTDSPKPRKWFRTSDWTEDTAKTAWNVTTYLSTDPNYPYRYYEGNGSDNTFYIFDSGVQTFSRTFLGYDTGGNMLPTPEDSQSFGDKIWAFQRTKNGGTENWVIVYDAENDVIISEFDYGLGVDGGWISISRSGKYLVIGAQFKSTHPNDGFNYVEVYSIQPNGVTFVRKDIFDFGHADLGITMQGNDVLVYRLGGNMRMRRLDNGVVTQLLGGDSSTTWFLIGHIGATNYNQPGWAYVYNNDGYSPYSNLTDAQRKYAYRKVLGVKLDENTSGYGETIFRQYGLTVRGADPDNHTTANNDGTILASDKFGQSDSKWTGVVMQQQTELGDEIPFNVSSIATIELIRKKNSIFTGVN